MHYETASTTQQARGEHRDTIKDCKIACATTWQGQGNHIFTTDKLCEQLQWSIVQQLSCTCQRQMSHNFWVTHLQFFCVHKTKWKVSKDEITQLHEYSELQIRNNFENSKSLYKAEQQCQAVVETRYKRTACMNRVMTVTTLLRSMSKAGRFHINSRLMIWCYNEDMTLSTTNITCENKRELTFLKSFSRCHFVFITSTQIFNNTSKVFSKNVL